MSKNSVRLTVCGTECVVSTEDDEAYVRKIADEVQACILELARQNEHASGTVTAIVAALSFCDDYHKASRNAEMLRGQIKDYLEDSSKARMEAEQARREISRLQQEVAALRARLGEPADAADRAGGAPVQRAEEAFSLLQPEQTPETPEQFLNHFAGTADGGETNHE